MSEVVVLNAPSEAQTEPQFEVVHLYCCTPNFARCGQRLDEWVDDSPVEDECIVCVEFDRTPCTACGATFDV